MPFLQPRSGERFIRWKTAGTHAVYRSARENRSGELRNDADVACRVPGGAGDIGGGLYIKPSGRSVDAGGLERVREKQYLPDFQGRKLTAPIISTVTAIYTLLRSSSPGRAVDIGIDAAAKTETLTVHNTCTRECE